MKDYENYEKIKRCLAISFMHYLDEIRPEGKMCLSNEECADIDKAFNEMDWDKLARYLEKQIPELQESENERIRKEILEDIRNVKAVCSEEYRKKADRWIAWLEKQKEQKPAEWSEEDEDNMRRIIRVLEDNDSDWKELSSWLKSLHPQPHWKPSKEQLLALRTMVVEYPDDKELFSLYEDLTKL